MLYPPPSGRDKTSVIFSLISFFFFTLLLRKQKNSSIANYRKGVKPHPLLHCLGLFRNPQKITK